MLKISQEDFEKLVENIASMDKDYKIVVEDVDVGETESQPVQKDVRTEIREAIKPQVDIVASLITTIKDAFEDNLDQTKRMNDAIDQNQSWEQTIRGACEQVIKTVEAKDGSVDRPESITQNSSKCSPKAFNKFIKNYTSRDYGVLQLAQAIMVFYNSLA
jgi:hypothetical protein